MDFAQVRDTESEGIGRALHVDWSAGRFGEGADGVAGAVEDMELPEKMHGGVKSYMLEVIGKRETLT